MKRLLVPLTILLVLTAPALAELPSASATVVNQALASGKPILIDLGARTCIPCKRMAPILEALAGDYRGKAEILFIDVREDAAAARKFGVQMIPTQIFFDAKGREVKRHIGEMKRQEIIQELKTAGLQ